MATIINAGQTALTVTPDTTGALTIQANGTSALSITANGQITTANAPFILTGGQIQFPATQIASGDGNCLDDYEEGTFTPAVTFISGTTGSPSYVHQLGRYTKIGRLVHLNIYLSFSKNTLSGGYLATITGLPYASSATSNYLHQGWCGWYNPSGTAFIGVQCIMSPNTSYIDLTRLTAANVDSAPTPPAVSEIGTALTLYISYSYYTS